jgi:hypothetical protein
MIYPSILSISGLEMLYNIFKITMKSNVVAAMEGPFHVNLNFGEHWKLLTS